ncbi:hypothetical protein DFJ73DRAFT_802312 [Zopfochytrium polystomum]|nr:hypothetical protein DFJ73DRAFT_802312 [Zopfochytrium polystomum]
MNSREAATWRQSGLHAQKPGSTERSPTDHTEGWTDSQYISTTRDKSRAKQIDRNGDKAGVLKIDPNKIPGYHNGGHVDMVKHTEGSSGLIRVAATWNSEVLVKNHIPADACKLIRRDGSTLYRRAGNGCGKTAKTTGGGGGGGKQSTGKQSVAPKQVPAQKKSVPATCVGAFVLPFHPAAAAGTLNRVMNSREAGTWRENGLNAQKPRSTERSPSDHTYGWTDSQYISTTRDKKRALQIDKDGDKAGVLKIDPNKIPGFHDGGHVDMVKHTAGSTGAERSWASMNKEVLVQNHIPASACQLIRRDGSEHLYSLIYEDDEPLNCADLVPCDHFTFATLFRLRRIQAESLLRLNFLCSFRSASALKSIRQHIPRTRLLTLICKDEESLDFVRSVETLQWWKDSGLELGYTTFALNDASRRGLVDVLQWWKDSGLPLKYDEYALEVASECGRIDVLQWWKDSGLPLEY